MGLVIAAAVLQAFLFLLFRVFDKRNVALMPAIAVNYLFAALCGMLVAPPWLAGDLGALWWPSAGIAVLFVAVFFLTGLTAQRAGVAASTVASKMSVILTVLFAVVVYKEVPGALGWTGLLFAVVGVVLGSSSTERPAGRTEWVLPLILFVGTACIDISINAVQRLLLTPETEAVFPTICLGIAAIIAFAVVLRKNGHSALRDPAVWIGGALLGVFNYGTLFFVVKALAHSGMQASTVFPLISIGVILFGTLGSVILFKERVGRAQWLGIGCATIALVLLTAAHR